MTGTQFTMASEWMTNGNIVEFVEANPDANRFQLVGFFHSKTRSLAPFQAH